MTARTSALGLTLALSALALTLPASAQNLVHDGDFETADPGASNGTTDYFGATGTAPAFDPYWTITQGTVGVDTGRDYVYDGNKSLWLNSDDPATSPTNAILQTLTTVPGQSYLLSFAADTGGDQPLTVTFGGAVVGGGPITVPANGFPVFFGGPGSNAAEFTTYSFAVTAPSASTDLTFSAPGGFGDGPGVTLELDDISVTAPASTPEPSSVAPFALLGLGLLGLTLRARRQKRAA